MNIIKRNGSEAIFEASKIGKAISKDNETVEGKDKLDPSVIQQIQETIEHKCSVFNRAVSVEEVQDMVEKELYEHHAYNLMKNYMLYRYERSLARQKNTTDDTILSLLDDSNEEIKQENSNKNPTIISVQRDYMAGEVSKDLVQRYLFPKKINDAHKDGIIHQHDRDYISAREHNCFTGGTRFITNYGVRQFKDFADGAQVYVKDLHGQLRLATVKKFGKQAFNVVTLKNRFSVKQIRCTANHRWVLQDGSITTNLYVGAKLYMTEDSTDYSINTYDEAVAFCMGFIVGDGTDIIDKNAVKVRLCGAKNQYAHIFKMAGFTVSETKENGDMVMHHFNCMKQNFLNCCGWRYMHPYYQALAFKGLYAADGHTKQNRIVTSDPRVEMFIEETSGLAGYYISSSSEYIHDTNFKIGARCKDYHFVKKLGLNSAYEVMDIRSAGSRLQDAWCVVEPVTHTFTLEGGIVTGNCDLIELDDMLQNGTCISGTHIDRPNSFATACNIATQIIAQVASSQYGGCTFSLAHLVPFIDVSRQKIRVEVESELKELGYNEPDYLDKVNTITEKRLLKEIKNGIQTIQYQLVTLQTTNGQAPFVSMALYLNEARNEQEEKDLALAIEEVFKQRILGVKNEKGVYITVAFPKLLYFLQENNTTPDGKYWYLTELAAKCTAKRLVPDYISEKKMLEYKIDKNGEGHAYPCMGCRSFLTPYVDPETGKPKYYGRFNCGVVTINLPDVALSTLKELSDTWFDVSSDTENDIHEIIDNLDFETVKKRFFEILDNRLEICHEALQLRHKRLRGTKSDVAPILWQHGALARLKKGETIDKLLYGGYCTVSLGYCGLYETVYALTGKSHTDPEVKDFALSIMQALNDACKKWKEAENIDYSLYGTPLESVTYRFAKTLQNRFGKIKEVTNHNYVTNSYH